MLHPERNETLGPLAVDLASAALALARRFHAGATMWCWAPDAPEHAQHVAVEFVHPVIMGKRALPAVAMTEGGDALGALRSLVRRGDVILVVSAAGHARVDAVLRRAASWGVSVIWIGAGERPAPSAAGHVLWCNQDAAFASHDGRLVLNYHLLWELTHVCLEHTGLLVEATGDDTSAECTTCSDQADVAEVIDAAAGSATVRAAGRLQQIDTTLIDDVFAGDLVLVHAGTALSIVDEA